MIKYVTPVVLDLIRCDQRAQAWQLIDFYMQHAQGLDDYDTLGYLALKADKRDTYLQCAQAAYALSKTPEQKYIMRMNLYKAYNMMNQPEKALFYIDQNLHVNPDDFEAQAHRAFNMSLMGHKAAAEALLHELIDLHPHRATQMEAAFSGELLRQGQFVPGLKAFLGTFKPRSGVFDEQLRMTRWDGVIRPGEIIYIEGEGGAGDEIINMRFLKRLRDLGMTPRLYSPGKYRSSIRNLLTRMGYQVLTDVYEIDPRKPWAPLMSLPALLNLKETDLWQGPYLTALRNSQNQLPEGGFKIGIKCSGNPYFAQDEYRKIPLDLMMQYLPSQAQLYYIDVEPQNHPGCISLHDRIHSWEDTLDFVDQMDCIVSSCTSLVHAAGAMGKPTHVAVPIAEYYIWTSSRTDDGTHWYGDNFKVARQTKLRDWHAPLQQIQTWVHEQMEKPS